jgi:hypothetical protein
MKNQFKKQFSAAITVLCFATALSMTVPIPIYADVIPSPTPDIFGSGDQLTPVATQSSGGGSLNQITNINGLTSRIASIGTVAVYLLTALAVVYIVWATVQYFIKGKEGDESRRAAGMNILWGIVGLFIIISLWGLVNLLLQTFGTDTTVPNKLPQANFVTNSATGQ